MRKEKTLQIVGVVIFLAVTTLTYGVVTPVNKTTNSSLDAVTSKITNMSTNTSTNTNKSTNYLLEFLDDDDDSHTNHTFFYRSAKSGST